MPRKDPEATLWIDLETYSETPISRGTFAYAADAEIMLVAWAIDDGPVQVWDLTAGEPMPALLDAMLADRAVDIGAHNAQFDMNVLWLAKNSDRVMRRAGENVERWRCTMAQALSHSLPAKLSALGALLGVSAELLKDDGHALVMQFCKPNRTGGRWTRATHPADWAAFVRYAAQDIVAMRECARKMPGWNWGPKNIALWHLDQRINRRGFAVDLDLATAAIDLCSRANKATSDAVEVLTDGGVTAVTQRDKLVAHLLAEHGVDLPDMRASTLERRIDDPDLPWAARELLALRLSGAKNSVSKYRTVVGAVSSDGRLRGTLQFRGAARTGRDAGRVFQPQNLPRPKAKQEQIDLWIEAAKAGATQVAGFDDIAMASDALRGLIVAGPGKKIVQADFSNIEGRIVAWYAGEQWKLKAFADFDGGVGPDLYNLTYARAFGRDAGGVSKTDRQKGKVLDLAGGYQGWVGACMTFAALYRVDVDEATAAKWMAAWREAHPATRAIWPRIEETAQLAIENPDKVFAVNEKLKMVRRGEWLKIQLPSGRCLSYPNIGRDRDGAITFAGQNQYTRKWQRVQTYGGKLFENIVQATAADLLWAATERAEAAGHPVVLRVHDELLTEVPDTDDYNVAGLVEIMTDSPAWAAGLPVAAAGFECKRYRKE